MKKSMLVLVGCLLISASGLAQQPTKKFDPINDINDTHVTVGDANLANQVSTPGFDRNIFRDQQDVNHTHLTVGTINSSDKRYYTDDDDARRARRNRSNDPRGQDQNADDPEQN